MSTLPSDKFSISRKDDVVTITSWNLGKPATFEDIVAMLKLAVPEVPYSKIKVIEGYCSTYYVCHL